MGTYFDSSSGDRLQMPSASSKREEKTLFGEGAFGTVGGFSQPVLASTGFEARLYSYGLAGKSKSSGEDLKVNQLKDECSEDFLRALLELRHVNIVEHHAFGQLITKNTQSILPIRATHIIMEPYAGTVLYHWEPVV